MKFISSGKIFFAALLCAFTFGTANAQSPDQQFGVGIVLNAGNNLGGQIQYAITPAFHIGTQIGFAAVSKKNDSQNNILFAPYGKFLFMGTPTFKPFIFGQFAIVKEGDADATNTLTFGGGAEYFINRNFGVFGGMGVVSLQLAPSSETTIGLATPFLGVEWFF